MFIVARCPRIGQYRALRGVGLLTSAVSLAIAGCSADITRFDSPYFATSDGNAAATQQRPATGLVGGSNGGGIGDTGSRQLSFGYAPPAAPPSANPSLASGSDGVEVVALPSLDGSGDGGRGAGADAPPAAGSFVNAPDRNAADRAAGAAPAVHRAVARSTEPVRVAAARPAPGALARVPASPGERGRQIEVRPGDTVYGLARRHGVSISELMSINALKSATIRPGQKLHLPAAAHGRAAERPVPVAAAPAVPRAQPAVARSAAPETPGLTEGWGGTYVVKPGDSLYAIARRYRVMSAQLQRANDITDARRLRPGTTLKVPGPVPEGARGPEQRTATQTAAVVPVASRPERREPASSIERAGQQAVAATPGGVRIINDGGDVARSGATAEPRSSADANAADGSSKIATAPAAGPGDKGRETTAVNAASGKPLKLRWPVKGRLIGKFGPRADGGHNDGIDLSVPFGTDVLAAEDGVVAYAGSEVKTYGNLVLLRHSNGWVTAYAYNDKLLVQRGDRVKRGQAVAKAGRSGAVDQPQVHFEVRVGARPVDPLTHLERF